MKSFPEVLPFLVSGCVIKDEDGAYFRLNTETNFIECQGPDDWYPHALTVESAIDLKWEVVIDETKSMPTHAILPLSVAEHIKLLRTGNVVHSWSRIAEIVVELHPDSCLALGWAKPSDAYGSSLFGRDLCRLAAEVLGECSSDWEDELDRLAFGHLYKKPSESESQD